MTAAKYLKKETRTEEFKISVPYSVAESVREKASRKGIPPSRQAADVVITWKIGHAAAKLNVDLSEFDKKNRKPRVLDEKQPFLNICDKSFMALNLLADDKGISVKQLIENLIDDYSIGHDEKILPVDELIKRIKGE